MRRWRCISLALILLGPGSAVARDIAVIANKASHIESMSVAELTRVCKGQSQHVLEGRQVTLITRDPATPEMTIVLEKIYAMPKEEVADLIASANHRRGEHPAIMVVDSDEALVKKVETTPGAIGLVDVYAITGGVKVVRVGDKLPLEPGYLLHGN